MKSFPHAASSRPIALLAGTVLAGSIALLFYFAVGIGDLKEKLPRELLDRQHALYQILVDLVALHHMVQDAASDPELKALESIREQAEITRAHLTEITWGLERSGGEAVASIYALVNPILNDVESWLDDGYLGFAPESQTVLKAMAFRTSITPGSVELLLGAAHDEAVAALGRDVPFLEKFRAILVPIVAQVLLIGSFFAFFALRAQRLAEANKLAQDRLRDAIEALPVAFSLYDKDAKLVMFNEKFLDMYPGPDEILVPGTSFSEITKGVVESGNLNLGLKEAEEWLSAREALFLDSSGSIEVPLTNGCTYEIKERPTAEGGTVTIGTDITEIRSRETELLRIGGELREKNIQLDAALDSMLVGLAMFDENCRLIVCNRRYLEIYSLPAELGREGTDLLEITAERTRIQGCSEEEAKKIIDRRMALAAERTDVEDRDYLSNGQVIRRTHRPTPDGGSIAIYEDITERASSERALRKAKEEAEMASRSKSDFLANVSHELRTPLNAIIGFSEIIKTGLFGTIEPIQYREYAGDIHDSGHHLLSLINDILDLSKIEAGKFEIIESDIDVADTVEALMRLVQDRAYKGQVNLISAIPDELPILVADLRAVKQILINLMSNAVKFTEAGGTVTIGAANHADGSLELSVTDTGIGMSKDDVVLALTPFGQVDSTFSRSVEGTGLGLPLSERLMSAHGGSLEVDSERDVGTCVTVRFPATRVQRSVNLAADWQVS